MRKIYLNNIPRLQAKKLLLENVRFKPKIETIHVVASLGRVTAEALFAQCSMPSYPASAMDGIAVKARDTYGANDQTPLLLTEGQNYLVVDTGDPIPEDFDAVIKIEEIQPVGEKQVEIMAPAAPWQHVRPVGEDVVAGEIIVPAYHCLSPPDLGAILAGGIEQIRVLAKPKVTIIPTGDELVAPGTRPKRGEIVEFNGTVIANYLRQWGAEPCLHDIVRDELQNLKQAVKEVLPHSDVVIINAGSSAGREDFTLHVLESMGEVLVHGIATRPGKPTILGLIEGKPVIGLPGYPVSAYLALDWFVKPLIYKYLHLAEPERPRLKAKLGRRLVSEMGSEEFVRMTVGFINGNYVANPLNRGAGITMSLVKAHGLLAIPAESLGYEQGEEVEIELLRPEQELRNTLMVVGSHDLTLDLLATALKRENPMLFLSSSHAGSMGGIIAIKRREAHVAGVHLFDSQTGEYNTPYLERYLAGENVILVNLVYRMQGWMVPPGNPLDIRKVGDIVRTRALFINRQRGAGTRLLFDYLLQQADISPSEILGYQREEYSHLNVAAAIAAGTAQVGLGILSAARAYSLDFIPVGEERYDLLMTRDFYHSPLGKTLLKVINDPVFQREVEALGGYSMRDAGKIMFGYV